ncbi:MAG: hypothetical protein ACPGJS_14010 [Flammeovirgaceae bacterium]
MHNKIVKKVIKYLLRGLLGIFILVLLLLALDSTSIQVDENAWKVVETSSYIKEKDVVLTNNLLKNFGKKKWMPHGTELAVLRALSHYPELKDVPIIFSYSVSEYELRSRPEPLSVLLPWRERRFEVLISQSLPPELAGAALHELPYNAQIGVLGHELAHTVSYLDKSSLALVWLGLKYMFSADFRKAYERETDRVTIEHQLRPQLREWSKAVHDKLEQVGRGGNYLTVEEIDAIGK